MSEQTDEKEELLPESTRKLWFYVSVTVFAILVLYYIAYFARLTERSPIDTGFSSIALFVLVCILFFGIPWARYGFTLKKFGPLEFERKLEGQSVEHVSDIAALEERLHGLERQVGQLMPPGEFSDASAQASRETDHREQEIEQLVIDFLTEYQRWSFSPKRIETWGSRQQPPRYNKLEGNSNLLRSVLRRLVAKGTLETRISEKGNTLYRIVS